MKHELKIEAIKREWVNNNSFEDFNDWYSGYDLNDINKGDIEFHMYQSWKTSRKKALEG
jgi:hypothetical protein